MGFKDLCQEYFETTDLYEVLGVSSNATEKEIKKAYHRLSLLVHPDRVANNEKATATEKFKVLGRIHSILQNKESRKCYDDCGEIDEENDSGYNWMEYWRAIFKKIDIKDIQNYEKEYIGSETELRDIKKAYVGTKGNMDLMLELIPFSNCDSEPRIQDVVRKMIDDEEVEEYPGFFNESKLKKKRRRSKWDEEKKMAEQIDINALEKEMELKKEERVKRWTSMCSDIEKKYGGGTKRKALASGSAASPKKTRTSTRRAAKK